MNPKIMIVKEINKVTFGIYSEKEILKMSVVELTSPKQVYDLKMGTTDHTVLCPTCNQTAELCTGHFGHIVLKEQIIHPLFFKDVLCYLKCFCSECNKLLISKDKVQLYGFDKLSGKNRLKSIYKKIDKVDICSECGYNQPTYKHVTADNSFVMIQTDGIEKVKVELKVEDIFKIFDSISDEDMETLGINPRLFHPRNVILSVLPVIPPCDRPYVKADGNLCDDDLTNQYAEIIKANIRLGEPNIAPARFQKSLQTLKFRVLTTFNNSAHKAKHTTNGRPIKCIKGRIAGKDGQLRSNIMGRRCDQTGRTVIGPDPTLKINQIALPIQMAKILTVPVTVNKYNIKKMENIVNSDGAKYLVKKKTGGRINLERAINRRGTPLKKGDIIIKKSGEKIEVLYKNTKLEKGDKIIREGVLLQDTKYPCKRTMSVEIGDTVERKLVDGDVVLLNRQPTLHKSSMMAMEIILRPGKTIRMNLAVTKPFNADFDKISVENSRH